MFFFFYSVLSVLVCLVGGSRYWSLLVSIFMSNLVFAETIINEAPKSPYNKDNNNKKIYILHRTHNTDISGQLSQQHKEKKKRHVNVLYSMHTRIQINKNQTKCKNAHKNK